MKSETVMVTGAGGYIGSVLVDMLLERGNAVVAVDRFFFGEDILEPFIQNDQLQIIKKDIRDLGRSDFEGLSAVYDLAAFSNDPAGDLDPQLTWNVNHIGRHNVAIAAKEAGVPRYVMSSTCSIYGAAGDGISDETSPPNPVSVYAQSNHKAETDLLAMCDENFVAASLRNATVFGVSRRMRFDLVVNLMVLSAFEKGRIVITGGGKQWRPLVHVRDVCEGLIALTEAPPEAVNGKCFNIGFGNFQVRSIASIVRETIPFPINIDIAPDDPDRRNYRVSFDRLRDEVGFAASRSIEDGVREVYEALKYGDVENIPKCSTVSWYRHILEAQKLVASVELDGRLL